MAYVRQWRISIVTRRWALVGIIVKTDKKQTQFLREYRFYLEFVHNR